MDHFCEINFGFWLLTIFAKKVRHKMFDWSLNMPLTTKLYKTRQMYPRVARSDFFICAILMISITFYPAEKA